MAVQIESLTGQAMLPYQPALAELRIRVFREWPYLYEGTLEYEREYLAHYAQQQDAIAVIARDEARVVGVATGMPLSGAADAFTQPFVAAGYRPEDVFYFGESVLLPEFRGQGIGRRFMDEREAQARRCDASLIAFCAVERAPTDPRKPADYRPLDAFWKRRGFRPASELVAHLSWREVGESADSNHRLGFWLKPL